MTHTFECSCSTGVEPFIITPVVNAPLNGSQLKQQEGIQASIVKFCGQLVKE
jgi:hypothetical protein